MKIVFTLVLILLSLTGLAAPEDDFVITIFTNSTGAQGNLFNVPINGDGYNYNIDCNDDGTNEGTAVTGDFVCNYNALGGAGSYTVRIKDNSGQGTGFPKFNSDFNVNITKIVSLDQWGTGHWTSMERMFNGATNMVVLATDTPDLSRVSSMEQMFMSAHLANPDVSSWDVSNVTNMKEMFRGAKSANPDVSQWDVSNVTNMSGMFYGFSPTYSDGPIANPDVSEWDVSSVTDMSYMFYYADAADPDVSQWDVSSVTNMSGMFNVLKGAMNPDVSQWDVSSVTDMSSMFYNASMANPDVSNWDVSSVTNMSFMFRDASSAAPDVSNWDVSSVTDMSSMFSVATSAKPDVSSWDVSSVTDMSWMFFRVESSDLDVSGWDVSSVTNMANMFYDTAFINADVSNWDVSSVTDMSWIFAYTQSVNLDLTKWDVSSVSDMSFMFYNSESADPNVSQWDVSSVTDMSNMFAQSQSAIPNISQWDVSSVTNMSSILEGLALPPWLYDLVLKNFNAQNLQSGISFHGGDSLYCESNSARMNMLNTYNWDITDGGLNCGSDVSVEFKSFEKSIETDQQSTVDLIISNTGYQDISNALVTTSFSAGYQLLTWRCEVVAGNAVCPTNNGTGNLSELVNLDIDEQLLFTFEFETTGLPDNYLLDVTANIDLVISADDIYQNNNQDSISATVTKVIFANGFD
ncbi:BspA family leucine-rich repeat surface protein [Marinicella sp. W31]|uniref:BspA family leucine-rich repeat surface protein n=1 Tax=Marinicella sp. W31 TaxID=3023713 RepID=UPI00375803B1